MKPDLRLVLLFVLPLSLAACKKESKENRASGEVLAGSVSDSMLPYDTVTSQPPLAPQTGTAGTGISKGKEAGSDETAPEASASASAEASAAAASTTAAAQ
jgi:hypothetical protein